MTVMVLLLLGGFGALYFGADWMVRGAARLEGSLGLSPIVIGLTVVSVGTSAPEFFVAVLAVLRGSADIAVGNVLGSNLANIGLILGFTALVRPLAVSRRVVWREIPIMILLTALLLPLMTDGVIGRADGVLLSLLLVAYLTHIFYRGRKTPPILVAGFSKIQVKGASEGENKVLVDVGLLVAGALGLLLGGRAIIESATFLSREFGISELAIGLTVVALGTSLPELATSVLAALRGQTDIAVGNVIGSNIFNLAGVLGVTGMIEPIAVDPGILWVEYPAVFLLSVLVFLVPLFPLWKGRYRIRRWEGALLFLAYFALGFWIF